MNLALIFIKYHPALSVPRKTIVPEIKRVVHFVNKTITVLFPELIILFPEQSILFPEQMFYFWNNHFIPEHFTWGELYQIMIS